MASGGNTRTARRRSPHGAVGGAGRELATLNAIAEALNSSADVRQALERTLALVADLLGLRTGWVWLLDSETNQFYLAAARELPPYLQEPVRMSGHWCLCTDLFRQGKLTPTNVDMLECSRLRPAVEAKDPTLTRGLRYHASIPLSFQGRDLGIMNIAGPAWRRLTGEELRLLAIIGYQAGIAVERARLAEEGARLARAEERARLAREIHDTLAQGLTAIGLDIEGALRHLADNPERARERLERALTTTHDNLEEARRSVLDLRAAPLAGRPLTEALAALGRAFTAETGVLARVRAEGVGEPALPLRVEAELYRIAQEALANVRRHARATQVELALRATPREVVLVIRDDGVGFASGRAAASGHGLMGMRERARLLGGRLQVASRSGRGTRVTARAARAGGGGVIHVVIVDDHPIVRQGLIAALEDESDFQVVGAAGSAEEALALVEQRQPEVILLDLELPGMGGIDAIPLLLEASPGAGVLVFTAYDTDERILAAVRAGATGYLLKGAATADIARAIRAVAGGGSALAPRVAATLVAAVRAPRGAGPLTVREREVLKLIAEGLLSKQIARVLGISERTVKFHTSALLRKLGADTRAQAVALAAQRGLLGSSQGR